MDAVLLSGFASARPGEDVIDLGTGNGIIPILMSAKTEGRSFTGLELQPESADMARRSVEMNGIGSRVRIVEGDLCEASEIFGASSFDVVTSNPPYMIEGHGMQNPDESRLVARHEIRMTLDDLLRETARLLKPHGRCYFIHRPFRLCDILYGMRTYRIEPKRMRLVYPYVDRAPAMVLLEGVRGGRPRLTVEKPLVIYGPDGAYTPEIHEIYGY